jgi:hypothetical protein
MTNARRRAEGLTSSPFVSCLCATEDREPFMPWLLGNFYKQDYPKRELVVVDSSSVDPALPRRPDISLIRTRATLVEPSAA